MISVQYRTDPELPLLFRLHRGLSEEDHRDKNRESYVAPVQRVEPVSGRYEVGDAPDTVGLLFK